MYEELFSNMEEFLATLYHGPNPDNDGLWTEVYRYECENMIDDIENFHKSAVTVGREISNESMANFLIYTEYMHIGNDSLINKKVDMNKIIYIAAEINDELN